MYDARCRVGRSLCRMRNTRGDKAKLGIFYRFILPPLQNNLTKREKLSYEIDL